ncbi:MAG TPA: dTDP-4-dehydrorhamnose 3,5-epimerase [Cytophagales bacterium]|nr:dTDP-4-dehydrorhamnose 3,5-epimerase [Cytophagales bacterium]
MRFIETPLKGAYIIELEPFSDDRGLFARTYCKRDFEKIGFDKEFVQFNFSLTLTKGTIRGLHYQLPPYSEIKLIKCVRGKVYDVLVDLRDSSPTYLKWFGVELSEENMKMVLIPEGFAHGFQTLEDNAQLIYHHTAFYTPGFEKGLRYNDPVLAIEWPLEVSVISEKDKNNPLLSVNDIKIK